MISFEMAFHEKTGRWRIWRVERELVAEGLTLRQGEKLLAELRAPGKLELQGCSLGGQMSERGDAPTSPALADTGGGVDMQDDTTDVNPRAEASAE